jgi:diguanylate cyclase (GGDEF)-like protein
VLVAVAQRLRRNVASTDLVARFGGDEFAVLLKNVTDPDIAQAIAERVLAAVSEPVTVDGRVARVTGSIGVATPMPGGTPVAALLRQADKALYDAKGAGKACVKVYESNVSLLSDRRALSRALLTEQRSAVATSGEV